MKLITFVCAVFLCLPSLAQEKFPDGTPVSDWFKDSKIVDINTLGKKYILTDYGAKALLPIPVSETNANPTLKAQQNPGY